MERDDLERRLFNKVCRGDLDAFEAFCVRVEAPVFTYLNRLVRNASDAEDLSQEALLRLYTMAREKRIRVTDGSPRALLFRIAHNLAMDHFRRARHKPELVPSELTPADDPVTRSLLREQIDMALAELPEAHRSAIMLREFGDLSYNEIADTLDATLDQVKVWIYRARKKLAILLDRDGQYIGARVRDGEDESLHERLGGPMGDPTHGD
jgi:RNA polymerase sigma-70 factor (ECF subfamily)